MRITFQFIPFCKSEDNNLTLISSAKIIERTEKIDADFTRIFLNGGARIEYDKLGNIRFSTEVSALSEERLMNIMDSAVQAINETFKNTSEESRVCLLLNGQNVVDFYLCQEDEILSFSSKRFNNDNPDFRELSDRTIKVSFENRAKIELMAC